MPDTCFSLALDVPNSKITEVPFALRARRVCFQQFPTRWLPASGRTKNIFCFIADKDWDYFRQILSIEGFLVPRGPRRSRRQSPLPDSVLRFQNRSWQFFLQPGFGISSLAKPINGLPEMIPACRTRPKKFLAASLRPCVPTSAGMAAVRYFAFVPKENFGPKERRSIGLLRCSHGLYPPQGPRQSRSLERERGGRASPG